MSTVPRQNIKIRLEQKGSEFTEATVMATRDLGGNNPSAAATVVVPISVGDPARRCEARAREYGLEEARSLLEILADDVQRENHAEPQ